MHVSLLYEVKQQLSVLLCGWVTTSLYIPIVECLQDSSWVVSQLGLLVSQPVGELQLYRYVSKCVGGVDVSDLLEVGLFIL
jgi:hypothetical protein